MPASQGAGRGVNFGWADCEGSFAETSTSIPYSLPGARNPVLDLFQHEGWHAVIGGYVVNDPSLPSLFGRYAFADNGMGELWSARLALPTRGTCATAARPDRRRVVRRGHRGLPLRGAADRPGKPRGGERHARALVPRERSRCRPWPTGPPRLRARVKRRQRVLRLRGAVARVSCNERCSIAAGGHLKIGRRSFRMRRASQAARARIRVALAAAAAAY